MSFTLSIRRASIAGTLALVLAGCGSASTAPNSEPSGRPIVHANGATGQTPGAAVLRSFVPQLLLYLAGKLKASELPSVTPELVAALSRTADRSPSPHARLATFTLTQQTASVVRAHATAELPSGQTFSLYVTAQLDGGQWRVTDVSDG